MRRLAAALCNIFGILILAAVILLQFTAYIAKDIRV